MVAIIRPRRADTMNFVPSYRSVCFAGLHTLMTRYSHRILPFRELGPALDCSAVELTVHVALSHTTSYGVVSGDIAFEARLSRTYPISQDGLRVRSPINTRTKTHPEISKGLVAVQEFKEISK